MKPCLPLKANATGMKTKYLLRKSKPKFICIVWQTLNPNHKPLLRRGLRFWFQFCCLRFARFWFKLQNEVCDHVLSKFRHFHWIPVSPVYIHWQISTLFSLKNAITPPDPRPQNQGMILRPHHIIFFSQALFTRSSLNTVRQATQRPQTSVVFLFVEHCGLLLANLTAKSKCSLSDSINPAYIAQLIQCTHFLPISFYTGNGF